MQPHVLGEGPVEYCAKMEVDSSGEVIEEIDLPPAARNSRLADVVPLQEILDLAHSLGIPTEKAYLDMKYDRRSESLEYLVSYYPEKPSPDYNKITLYIKAHDPKDYYWWKSEEMASLEPGGRAKQRLNATSWAVGEQVTAMGVFGERRR